MGKRIDSAELGGAVVHAAVHTAGAAVQDGAGPAKRVSKFKASRLAQSS